MPQLPVLRVEKMRWSKIGGIRFIPIILLIEIMHETGSSPTLIEEIPGKENILKKRRAEMWAVSEGGYT